MKRKPNSDENKVVERSDSRSYLLENQTKRMKESISLGEFEPINVNASTFSGLIIFDWDDTLFPTTWSRPFREDIKLLKGIGLGTLTELDEKVVKVLKQAKFLTAQTFIVTNGSLRWVEASSHAFLPKTYEFLFGDKTPYYQSVEVISARDEFERTLPNEPVQWKINVFQEILDLQPVERTSSLDSDSESLDSITFNGSPLMTALEYKRFSFVSIGDGEPERVAARECAKEFEECETTMVILGGCMKPSSLVSKIDEVASQLEVYFESRSMKSLFNTEGAKEVLVEA